MFGANRRCPTSDPLRLLLWTALLALTALGLTSCGGKGGKTAKADKGLLGRWESVDRSPDGRGNTLELTSDSKLFYTMGVMIDGRYHAEGDQLTVTVGDTTASDHQSRVTSFRVKGDTLTILAPTGGAAQALVRTGEKPKGEPIAGTWTYSHPLGASAYEAYSPEGAFHFRLPVQTVEGTYSVTADTLELRLPNSPANKAAFTITDGTLRLVDAGGRQGAYARPDRTLASEASRAAAPPAGMAPPPDMPAPGGQAPPVDPPTGGQ